MHQTKAPKGSRSGKVRQIVGDDYYDLKLTFEQIVELEDVTNVGAFYMLKHMMDVNHLGYVGDFRAQWVYEIIRLGLIGSGEMSPREAIKHCDRHLRGGFLHDYIEAATHCLYAGTHGPEDEPVKVDEPAGEPEPEVDQPLTPSADENGVNSTPPPEASDSLPPT